MVPTRISWERGRAFPRPDGVDYRPLAPTMAPNSAPLAAKRILIVDDQDSIRSVLRTALTEAGAEVLDAGGGAAGVEMATRQIPDLILLDIAMPGMNGWQVLEALRSVAETASIPVVLETSSGD